MVGARKLPSGCCCGAYLLPFRMTVPPSYSALAISPSEGIIGVLGPKARDQLLAHGGARGIGKDGVSVGARPVALLGTSRDKAEPGSESQRSSAW